MLELRVLKTVYDLPTPTGLYTILLTLPIAVSIPFYFPDLVYTCVCMYVYARRTIFRSDKDWL